MKTKSVSLLLLVSLTLAGCAKKRPNDLPPTPATGALQDAQPSTEAEDSLEALRRDFLAQAGSDTVYFETDSSLLDAEARAILEAQALWLLRHPAVSVSIEGHCDERGTREYNLALGERRANAAKNLLAARGVAESRMRTVSWGKERPAAPGSNEAAWAQNRRAVTVLPTSR